MTAVQQKLLNWFLGHPTAEVFEREAKEKARVSAGAANSGLAALAKGGFLLMERAGRMKFFRLNRENPRIKQMKITHTLSRPVMEKLEKLRGPQARVFLYGSAARGEDVEESDIDILVVGEASLAALRKAVPDKKVKFSLFTAREWADMRKKDPAFYERVEKDKKEL